MVRTMAAPAAAALIALLAAGCSEAPPPAPSEHWQRVDAGGQLLESEGAGEHRCVFDRRTGLMWQLHDDAPGLRHHANRYTWLSSDRQVHMSEPGLSDGGSCTGSRCDTEGLVEALNQRGLCGHTDWRMPGRDELMSLVDARLRDTGVTLDRDFFPAAAPVEYWTADTFRLYPQSAWAVDFKLGLDRADVKGEAKAVRLVRRHAAPVQED